MISLERSELIIGRTPSSREITIKDMSMTGEVLQTIEQI
jgi:hypothetical protein